MAVAPAAVMGRLGFECLFSSSRNQSGRPSRSRKEYLLKPSSIMLAFAEDLPTARRWARDIASAVIMSMSKIGGC